MLDKAFRLMRRREMRRMLGMPQAPGETQYDELLAHNATSRTFPGLLGVAMGDLKASTTRLLAPQRSRNVDHPLTPHFLGKGINPVVFDWARRGPLDLYRYEDVSMLAEGGMVTIFRGQTVDTESTGLSRAVNDLKDVTPVHVARGAYIDDIYRPTNPCHFMVDRLPRAFHYTRLADIAMSDCITVNATSDYPLYALERVAPEVRRLDPLTLYHFDELFVLSTCARPIGHPFFFLDREVVDFVVPAMTAELPAPSRRRRIYLSRFASERRKLVNEKKIADALKDRGFEILEMSDFSPRDQLAAVREAELIVAPHGAALANLVGATPHNRVIELFNPRRGTAAYGAMAVAVGAPYTPLFGTPQDRRKLDDPWLIDPARVVAAIDDAPTWAGAGAGAEAAGNA